MCQCQQCASGGLRPDCLALPPKDAPVTCWCPQVYLPPLLCTPAGLAASHTTSQAPSLRSWLALLWGGMVRMVEQGEARARVRLPFSLRGTPHLAHAPGSPQMAQLLSWGKPPPPTVL